MTPATLLASVSVTKHTHMVSNQNDMNSKLLPQRLCLWNAPSSHNMVEWAKPINVMQYNDSVIYGMSDVTYIQITLIENFLALFMLSRSNEWFDWCRCSIWYKEGKQKRKRKQEWRDQKQSIRIRTVMIERNVQNL